MSTTGWPYEELEPLETSMNDLEALNHQNLVRMFNHLPKTRQKEILKKLSFGLE